jgi:hypothetical protein
MIEVLVGLQSGAGRVCVGEGLRDTGHCCLGVPTTTKSCSVCTENDARPRLLAEAEQ